MFIERQVKNDIILGHTMWAKMTLPGGKLLALLCRPTKTVNKSKEITNLPSTNIGINDFGIFNYKRSFVVNTRPCTLKHLRQ
jgi:hypothetical protein